MATYDGRIEAVEIGPEFILLSGWLVDAASGRIPAAMVVSVGGRLVDATWRTVFRDDLALAGKGDGYAGFRAVVQRRALPAELSVLSVGIPGDHGVLVADSASFEPGRVRGAFDQFDGRTIAGWVDDSNVQPRTEGGPRLRLPDGTSLAIAARSTRPDVVNEALAASPGVGFAVPIHEVGEALFGRGSTVRPAAAPEVVLECDGRELARQRLDVDLRIEGRVERHRDGMLVGWAIRRVRVGLPVDIEVLVDGIPYATATAGIPRDDLRKVAEHHDGGGFQLRLPFSPTDGSRISVSLRALPDRVPIGPEAALVIDDLIPADDLRICTRDRIDATQAYGEVAIVVPVYNAAPFVRECLEAVLRHTSGPARLIIVDDASTDPEIGPLLEGFASRPGVELLRNATNVGFTGASNRGMKAAGRADVVLLNSDAVVGPRWLDNLRQAAYAESRIGSVTAVSDNAGAFSVPAMGESNPFPPWFDGDGYARAIAQSAARLRPRVPTGNGFCLYIRRDCLDSVGQLDDVAFPRGYGEENDFCMRALRAGWHHVVDDRTLVLHRRSASFGAARDALAAAGLEVIQQRYPEYARLTNVFSSGPELRAVRYLARRVQAGADPLSSGRQRLLFVVSTRTGGTPQTNEDLMHALRQEHETWLLSCDAHVVSLSRWERAGSVMVRSHRLRSPVEPGEHRSSEYDEVVGHWLSRFSFELVHIRHISWHGLGLIERCHALRIPVIFSFHDFYAVCPTVKLLDENQRHCAGTCSETRGECRVDLWPPDTVPPLKHRWVGRWREMQACALALCSAYVTTTGHAKALLLEHFPFLAERPFPIIAHGRDFPSMAAVGRAPGAHERLRILVPGNIDVAKGARTILALRDADSSGRIEFHILGDADDTLHGPRIVRHGKYQRNEFAIRAMQINPHIGAVFSIWPETHCHTLSEMWALGLPVVGLDLGAVGERIRASEAGWLFPHDDIAGALAGILRIADDGEGFARRLQAVRRWQEGEGRRNDLTAMAIAYSSLYERVLGSAKAFRHAGEEEGRHGRRPRIGVVAPGDANTDRANGSTHVRTWEWTRNSSSRRVRYVRGSIASFVDPRRPYALDGLLVQRTAVDAWRVEETITMCDELRLPLIFEMDDDLLDVPPEKDPSGAYRQQRPMIERLIAAARVVTVSTSTIAERLRRLNDSVHVVENRLSARLWFTPLPIATPVPELARRQPDELRILYMGSATHRNDLALLHEPLAALRRRYPQLRLYVVGGDAEPAAWYEAVKIPAGAENYPAFVAFFRAVAATMDLAVAPLVDSPFNRAKSDLKFLEYSGAGLPGIYGDLPAYREVVERSGHGLLASSGTQSWSAALQAMIDRRGDLADQGRQAQAWVRDNRCLETVVDRYDALIRTAVEGGR